MALTKVWLYHPLDIKGGVYNMYSAATLLPMPQQLPVLAPAALLILAGAEEEENLDHIFCFDLHHSLPLLT